MLKKLVLGQVVGLAMTHVDDNGKRVDLTGSTSLEFQLVAPDGTTTVVVATVDPVKNWRTVSGLWTPTAVGEWVIRSLVTMVNGTKLITRDQYGRFEVVDA